MKDLIEYKKYVALAKKTFKRKKKECFRNFASSIDFRTDPKYVWNKCKIFKHSWINNNPKSSTENLQYQKKLEENLNKISPPWVQTSPDYVPLAQNNEFFDSSYSFTEFNIALDPKKQNSAPGMDGIDYEVIAKLPIKYHSLLLDVYNEMYITNDYPSS